MARVLVTGASTGIGRAVAVAAAGRGDRVAVHYRSDRAGAERTLGMLDGDGAGHVVVSGDVADPDSAERLVSGAVEGLGGIDVLVHAAAVAPAQDNRHRPGESTYAEWTRAWRRMVDVDLLGAASVAYLVAEHLIGRGAEGSIVTIGSRGAFRGEPDHPAYAAAKAGLHAMGQSMAQALAPHGIAVTSVAPGFVSSDRQVPTLAGPGGDALRAQSPFGRVGTPEEVAAAVMYLTSPEARWASGAILDLNGASHLRS